MKKRLLAVSLAVMMLINLFPVPALALEAQRPEWAVTAFDPLDEGTALQTVPQGGGEPVLPDTLTAWAYQVEDDTEVTVLPEQTPPEGEQPPADEQGPDIQQITISNVTWTAEPEYDHNTPGAYIYTPVLPAAYAVDEGVELPAITVTVEAAREPEQTAVERVQALIDALPDPEGITADDAEDAAARLAAIDEAGEALTEDKRASLDFTRYEAVMLALAALMDDTPTVLDTGIKYLDWDNSQKKLAENTYTGSATVVESGTTTWNSGWYVVNSDVTVGSRITVNGDVHLILADGYTLTAKNSGIHVGNGNSLTIYAQSTAEQMGALTATPSSLSDAALGQNSGKTGGTITINGGHITATGGWAEAIGGQQITINGGLIDAKGSGSGTDGSGINGRSGSTILIRGGTVNSSGSNYAAGIGGNSWQDGGTIIISGGIVNAIGNQGAGIGGGENGKGGTVTISGGIVTTRGITGIGGGATLSGIAGPGSFSTGENGGAVITATGTKGAAIADQSGQQQWNGIVFMGSNTGKVYGSATLTENFTLDGNRQLTIPSGTTLNIPQGVTLTNDETIKIDGTLTNSGVIINGGTITGTVGGTGKFGVWVTFDANGGSAVTPNKILNINNENYQFPVSNPSRTGYTFDSWYTAASGGTKVESTTQVTITEGQTLYAHWTANQYTVTFNANQGSVNPVSQNVTYNDTYGTLPIPTRNGYTFTGWYTMADGGDKIESETQVTATSDHTLYARWVENTPYIDESGAAHGAGAASITNQTTWTTGWYVVDSNTAISGRITVSGDVKLILADGFALTASQGINVSDGNSLTIYAQSTGANMGKLTATGGASQAGIGGNNYQSGGTITINGGTVTATAPPSNGDPAGIGGGGYGNAGTITINGGIVTATGSQKGIGSGAEHTGGTITINGGTVTTNGIGTGYYDASASTEITGGIVICTDTQYGGINKTNQGTWNGVVIEGNSGKVYGSSVTIKSDLEIPAGMTLTIPKDTTLTINQGVTLTVNGNVNAQGTTVNNGNIVKKTQTAPNTPTASARTADSITLKAVSGGIGGVEYRCGNGEWQTGTAFSGLSAGTAYTFTVHYKGNDYYQEAVSGDATIYTAAAQPDPGVGYAIDYAAETITVTDGYEVSTSQYFSSKLASGATVTPDTTYYVRKAQDGGIPASAPNSFRTGARPATPTAPVIASRTHNTITVQTVSGQEYRRGSETWQDGGAFSGLTDNWEYTIYTRKKAVANASFASLPVSATAKTKTAPAEAPTVDAPAVTANSVILPANSIWEYSTNQSDWSDTHEFTGLNAATPYTYYVRVKETDTAMASQAVTVTVWTAAAQPDAGMGYAINYTDETATITTGYEASTDNSAWNAGTVTITPGGRLHVRVAAVTNGAPASESRENAVPARPDAPAAAATVTKTTSSFSVTNMDAFAGCQFSIDGSSWQDGGEFTGLNAGESYTLHVRVKATDAAFASPESSREVTTVNADGSTTVKPGESAEIGTSPKTTVTNNGENITITVEGGKTTTITPAGEIEVGPGGGVTVSGGSTVKTGDDGLEVKLPQGGTVGGGGEITVPGGGTAQVGTSPSTTITVPTGGGTIQPKPGGTVEIPGGSTVQTGEDGPEITVGPGNGGTIGSGGGITVPEGGTVQVGKDPATTVTPPAGGTIQPKPDGGVDVPGGTTVKTGNDSPEITVGPGNGGTVGGSGGITVPGGGTVQVGGSTITLPSGGGTVKPNPGGTIPLPGGSTVTKPDGEPITIPGAGGTYDPGTGTVTENVHTVTFDSQGGSAVSSIQATHGGKISKPADPSRSGYTFGGWYKESGCATAWNFNTDTVDGDTTLYAKWTKVDPPAPATHTVSFNSQGGSAVGSATVTHGGKIPKPTDPSRSGYTFGGWYKESGCTTAWDFDTDAVTGSLTLYAKWTSNSGGGGSSGGSSGGGGSYSPTTYPPKVKPGAGGSASIEPAKPKRGDTVTVRPKPDAGYEVESVTVTDRNGKAVQVKQQSDGTYAFTQPNGKVEVEVTYKPVEPSWSNPYTDVPEGAWYHDAVRFASESGLMYGYGDGTFGPDDNLSRAQLAQILFNKEGRPVVNYLMQYGDVATGAWYAEAVRWATSQGIVGSYGNGNFGPNDPITREQLAVMLWRYSGSPAATNKELHFNDTDEISGFALEAMRWAVENGILNGYGDGRLGPQGQATRAQVAQMLKNFIENQEKYT